MSKNSIIVLNRRIVGRVIYYEVSPDVAVTLKCSYKAKLQNALKVITFASVL
jgi:hypothetical protein